MIPVILFLTEAQTPDWELLTKTEKVTTTFVLLNLCLFVAHVLLHVPKNRQLQGLRLGP